MISGTACSGGNSHKTQAATAENAKPESPLTTPARNNTTAMALTTAGLKPPPMCKVETNAKPSRSERQKI
jgi:hypothetical protein